MLHLLQNKLVLFYIIKHLMQHNTINDSWTLYKYTKNAHNKM